MIRMPVFSGQFNISIKNSNENKLNFKSNSSNNDCFIKSSEPSFKGTIIEPAEYSQKPYFPVKPIMDMIKKTVSEDDYSVINGLIKDNPSGVFRGLCKLAGEYYTDMTKSAESGDFLQGMQARKNHISSFEFLKMIPSPIINENIEAIYLLPEKDVIELDRLKGFSHSLNRPLDFDRTTALLGEVQDKALFYRLLTMLNMELSSKANLDAGLYENTVDQHQAGELDSGEALGQMLRLQENHESSAKKADILDDLEYKVMHRSEFEQIIGHQNGDDETISEAIQNVLAHDDPTLFVDIIAKPEYTKPDALFSSFINLNTLIDIYQSSGMAKNLSIIEKSVNESLKGLNAVDQPINKGIQAFKKELLHDILQMILYPSDINHDKESIVADLTQRLNGHLLRNRIQ